MPFQSTTSVAGPYWAGVESLSRSTSITQKEWVVFMHAWELEEALMCHRLPGHVCTSILMADVMLLPVDLLNTFALHFSTDSWRWRDIRSHFLYLLFTVPVSKVSTHFYRLFFIKMCSCFPIAQEIWLLSLLTFYLALMSVIWISWYLCVRACFVSLHVLACKSLHMHMWVRTCIRECVDVCATEREREREDHESVSCQQVELAQKSLSCCQTAERVLHSSLDSAGSDSMPQDFPATAASSR